MKHSSFVSFIFRQMGRIVEIRRCCNAIEFVFWECVEIFRACSALCRSQVFGCCTCICLVRFRLSSRGQWPQSLEPMTRQISLSCERVTKPFWFLSSTQPRTEPWKITLDGSRCHLGIVLTALLVCFSLPLWERFFYMKFLGLLVGSPNN